jgi:hypothetical protein
MNRDRAPHPYAESQDTSPALAVGGMLMVGVTLLIANPSFGLFKVWPWEQLLEESSSLTQRTVFGLWLLTGLWFLCMSFTKAAGVRSAVGLALCGVLSIQMLGLGPGEFRIQRYHLHEFLPLVAFGAGLLLWIEPTTARMGRWITFTAGVAFLCANFAAMSEIDGVVKPRMVAYWEQLESHFVTGASTATPDAGTLWVHVLPRGGMLLSAALGALCALVGLSNRKVVLTIALLLGASAVAPLVARPIVALTMLSPGVRGIAQQLTFACTEDAVILIVLTTLTFAEFARLHAPVEGVQA